MMIASNIGDYDYPGTSDSPFKETLSRSGSYNIQ